MNNKRGAEMIQIVIALGVFTLIAVAALFALRPAIYTIGEHQISYIVEDVMR